MEKIENYLPSVNLVSAHHSPDFYWELEERKKTSEMNTLSPFISLAAHSVRESVVSVKAAQGLLGFIVPHSFFCHLPWGLPLLYSLSLFKPPPDMSDSLNSTPAAHQTTKLIHLWPPTVKSGSNKSSTIDPLSGTAIMTVLRHQRALWSRFTFYICFYVKLLMCETSFTKGLCECRLDQGAFTI